ncbi:hypothetical protein MHM_04590 [Candidatus Mycoplasma haemominutum 'Birmingham 1']|uniref:Uncharacterized protein n=1 Tax=Candidatus Mycoplasma haematominutum 'Birmingham 1' TaxID=1116213 RepID=G8C3S9_9MOLU|nr:hypothetical protein MHM_04590 [Candidatus Mycoplasma haematominutum 'Birmingham 1']
MLVSPLAIISGGGAIAGVATLEFTQGFPISGKVKSWGTSVFNVLKSSGSTSTSAAPISWTFLYSWIPSTWASISSFFQTLGAFFTSSVQIATEAQTHIPTLKQAIEGLNTTLFVKAELSKLLENWYTKIPKIVSFAFNTQARTKFTNLFSGAKAKNALEAFKVLSGNSKGPNEVFKVEDGVLAHLMNRFAEAPVEVIDKIDRLVNLISSAKEKYANLYNSSSQSSGEGSSTQTAMNSPYLFNKERLDQFLKKRRDSAQEIYELGVKAEIGIHALGLPVPPQASLLTSLSAAFLDHLFSNGSR